MNEVKALYSEFRSGIINGERLCFDEDNLIDIFDYARDQGDFFIQLEVILLAGRLYPESSELAIRRGFIYEDSDSESFGDFIQSNRDNVSLGNLFLWRILMLEKEVEESGKQPDSPEIVRQLKNIIAESDWLYDEDIFRLRDFIFKIGCGKEFLQENIDVSSKVDNLATWYYELGCIAFESEIEGGIPLLIKSSDIDPFRIQTWLMLAAAYIEKKKIEDAEYSLEFVASLREDPELYEQEMLLNSEIENSPECIRRALDLCRLMDYRTMTPETFMVYIGLLEKQKRREEAKTIFLKRLEESPNLELMAKMCLMYPDSALRAIEASSGLFESNPSEIYDELCDNAVIPGLLSNGMTDAALKLSETAGLQIWHPRWTYDYILAKYVAGKYEDLLGLEAVSMIEALSIPVSFFLAFSYASLGMTDEAERVIRNRKSYDKVMMTVVSDSRQLAIRRLHNLYLESLGKEIAAGKKSFSNTDYPLI